MKNLVICVAILVLPLVTYAGDGKSAESEVRAAAADFNDAYMTNDIERYFSYYADDAVVYWFGERQDMSAYHDEWKAMIEAGGGVETNEVSQEVFQILPGGKAAVASYFVHNVTRDAEGEAVAGNFYETEVWQKMDGEWKVINLHYTEIVPVD